MKKTNEWGWKQREEEEERTYCDPAKRISTTKYEKGGSQVLHFQKQLTLFEKSAEWERKMKH